MIACDFGFAGEEESVSMLVFFLRILAVVFQLIEDLFDWSVNTRNCSLWFPPPPPRGGAVIYGFLSWFCKLVLQAVTAMRCRRW